MRKYFWIGFFVVLVIAGLAGAAYLRFNEGKTDWSVYMLASLPIMTGAIVAILNWSKMIEQKNRAKIINPPSRNENFVGRNELLKDLRQTFRKNKTPEDLKQVISGMGGIGKTETALEYALRYYRKYKCICWVNAELDGGIHTSLENFAAAKNLINNEKVEPHIIKEKVRQWMLQNNNWLFVFDNIVDEANLLPCLPVVMRKGQHILITSQCKVFNCATVKDIDVLTEAEARKLIEKYAEKPADVHCTDLVNELGRLPLALVQAGAYIGNSPKGYKEYLDSCKTEGKLNLLKETDARYKKTVAFTLQKSIEKIHQMPASIDLLNLFAFLAPDHIDRDWFTAAKDVLPEALQAAVPVYSKYTEAIAVLIKYSLVSQNKEGILSIHRLVQEVIRESLKDEQSLWRNHCVNILNELRYTDFSTRPLRDRFLILATHIIAVTKENIMEETEELANLYDFLGWGYDEMADYDSALEYFEKALPIREKVLGLEHPDTASTNNNMALVYDNMGDYKRALEYYGKALAIYEKILGLEHPDTATTYNNIGEVYRKKGDYKRALEYYGKTLAIDEKVSGLEHPLTATTYNNLAIVYYAQGDYERALKYHKKALAIRVKVLGLEHPDTATTYNNMANVYNKQGDYDRALEYYEKALAIREKVLGLDHPDTASTYNNMAIVYDAQCKYKLALEYHEKAKAVREKVLGKEHPDTANTYNNMANVYDDQGKYKLALEYYGKALTIYEKVFGTEHPYYKKVKRNIKRTSQKLINNF